MAALSQIRRVPERSGKPTSRRLPLYRTATVLLAALLLWVARAGATESQVLHVFPVVEGLICVWFLLHAAGIACSRVFGRSYPSDRVLITCDVVLALALIACTGAVDSVFLPVLLSAILSVSVVYKLRPALLTASASVAVLCLLTLSPFATLNEDGWARRSAPARSSMVISSLVGQGIAVHGIAFLGVRLVGGLRQMAGLNDRIVASIGEGIVALDEKGRMILVNQEALRILNYPENTDWCGRRPGKIFRRGDDDELRAVLSAPTVGEHEVSWTLGREEQVPLSIRLTTIAGERGPSGWVAVLQDLTLRKRAAAAEGRVRHLEELEDLALGLVHEVRNPLASIRGCVQELGRGNLEPEQTKKFSGIVLRESDRLDRIVDEFLEYSRTSPTQQVPVDLALCLQEVQDSLASRHDSEEIDLQIVVPDDPVIVSGHPEMLYRVFSNLGINAIEAIRGKGQLRFELQAGRPDGWQVIVDDDGPGMSEEVSRRIFNPFFSTKPREGGLGLALVERIVHGHEGTIEVSSEQGKGTRFRVWIPGDRSQQHDCREPELAARVETA